MSIPVAEILESIVGAPVCNVNFSFEFYSQPWLFQFPDGKSYDKVEFSHGIYEVYIDFDCSKELFLTQDYRYGSLIIGAQVRIDYNLYRYSAVLVRGAETEAIANAIYQSLKVN